MPEKKSITFVSRRAPYGSHNSQLCLDMALAYSVFDQRVNYIFLDDGVYQLRKGQRADAINRKSLGGALETLPLYGIDEVLVDADSLRRRVLELSDLVLPARVVTSDEIATLLRNSDAVFSL